MNIVNHGEIGEFRVRLAHDMWAKQTRAWLDNHPEVETEAVAYGMTPHGFVLGMQLWNEIQRVRPDLIDIKEINGEYHCRVSVFDFTTKDWVTIKVELYKRYTDKGQQYPNFGRYVFKDILTNKLYDARVPSNDLEIYFKPPPQDIP